MPSPCGMAAPGQLDEMFRGLHQRMDELFELLRTQYGGASVEAIQKESKPAGDLLNEVASGHRQLVQHIEELDGEEKELERSHGELARSIGELQASHVEVKSELVEVKRSIGELKRSHGELARSHGELARSIGELKKVERERKMNLLLCSFVTALEKRLNMIVALDRQEMPECRRDLQWFNGSITEFCDRHFPGKNGWRNYDDIIADFAPSRVVDRLFLMRTDLIDADTCVAHVCVAPDEAKELLGAYMRSLPTEGSDLVQRDFEELLELFESANRALKARARAAGAMSTDRQNLIVNAVDAPDDMFCDVWWAIVPTLEQ